MEQNKPGPKQEELEQDNIEGSKPKDDNLEGIAEDDKPERGEPEQDQQEQDEAVLDKSKQDVSDHDEFEQDNSDQEKLEPEQENVAGDKPEDNVNEKSEHDKVEDVKDKSEPEYGAISEYQDSGKSNEAKTAGMHDIEPGLLDASEREQSSAEDAQKKAEENAPDFSESINEQGQNGEAGTGQQSLENQPKTIPGQSQPDNSGVQPKSTSEQSISDRLMINDIEPTSDVEDCSPHNKLSVSQDSQIGTQEAESGRTKDLASPEDQELLLDDNTVDGDPSAGKEKLSTKLKRKIGRVTGH